jgi:hypothetical protein
VDLVEGSADCRIVCPLGAHIRLFLSLQSGVVLCQLVNVITAPDIAIKKYAKTNLLPLMEMDNIQLYLKV